MVIVRSNVENGNVENHFGLFFTNAHGVVIHVAFSQDQEIGDNESEALLHLGIAYLSLLEFNDTNSNQAYDPGVDNVYQTVNLQNLTYTPLGMPKTITSQDGKSGYEIRTNSTNGGKGLLFGVVADIFPQYARVDNTIVPPTATKITTIIQNFPFTHKGDSRDMVALQVRAESKTVIEQETPQNESSIRVRSATAQGFYSWTPTATVGSNQAQVHHSLQKLDRRWLINLAYPQGQTIVHDPLLGFSSGSTPILTGSLLIGAAVASISVFGLLVYAGRRQLPRVFSPKVTAQ